MLRTVLLIALVVAIFSCVAGVVYVTRLRAEAVEPLRRGCHPPRTAFSSAFTDALWSQVERSSPVDVDTSVSLVSLLAGAATKTARQSRGFLLASVAAHSIELAQAGEAPIASDDFTTILREIFRAHALLLSANADDLAATYAATAPFGGAVVGIDAAAAQLFGKPAALLDATEAATLVVISWTPNRCDVSRLRDRRNALLGTMLSLGLVPAAAPPPDLGVPALVLGSLCTLARPSLQ